MLPRHRESLPILESCVCCWIATAAETLLILLLVVSLFSGFAADGRLAAIAAVRTERRTRGRRFAPPSPCKAYCLMTRLALSMSRPIGACSAAAGSDGR